MRILRKEDLEAIKNFEYIKPAVSVDSQCGAKLSGTRRECTRDRGHIGVHVSHNWRGQVLAAWGDREAEDELHVEVQVAGLSEDSFADLVRASGESTDASTLVPLAEGGDAEAQWRLGEMCCLGLDVPQDYASGARWYRKAAEQGHPNAQNDLGVMYVAGQGVSQDMTEALEWFRKAAEKGSAEAEFNLGSYFLTEGGDYAEAVKWLCRAAAQGKQNASAALIGLEGVEAVKALGDAAALGDAEAQYHFACRQSCGHDPDHAEALRWYRKAAAQGHPGGQTGLGMAYAGGLGGVSEDFAEALKWYRMAAHQGDMNAMHNLGVMYDWGQGVQQDWVEAEKWYRKAAELGHLEAQSQLRGRPNAVRKIAILIKSLRPKDRE